MDHWEVLNDIANAWDLPAGFDKTPALTALRKALEAEREACAKIAESGGNSEIGVPAAHYLCRDIAAAIRNRQ